MEYRFTRISSLIFPLIGLMLLLNACKEEPGNFIPEDGPPVISLVSPTSNNFLRLSGEEFTATFQLADNEALAQFRAVALVFNEQDSVIGDFIYDQVEVSGTNVLYDFEAFLISDPYSKARFTCYAIDSKGAIDSAIIWLSILPEPINPAPFEVLRYENDSIFNFRSNVAFRFNFTQRNSFPDISGPGNVLDTDIEESAGSQGLWEPRLISPNNAFFNRDSVFVLTDASRFNYNEASYETIAQAWFSDPSPASETPVLAVDDIVIVRLTKSPQPQFAVMRITRLEDDGAGLNVRDRLIFDYMVTSQP